MPNMQQVITGHNKGLLNKKSQEQKNKPECNCRKGPCPLDGHCLSENIIYQAAINNEINPKVETYLGLCSTEFKPRYRNHTKSINNEQYRTETTFSEYIWSLMDNNIKFVSHY